MIEHLKQDGALIPREPESHAGHEIWHAYEFSWLNSNGKPLIAVLRLTVPRHTLASLKPQVLKGYLNNYSMQTFAHPQLVIQQVTEELGTFLAAELEVALLLPDAWAQLKLQALPGYNLDELNIILDYQGPSPHFLKHDSEQYVSHSYHSQLIRFLDVFTHQPSWATLILEQRGPQIVPESLLTYLLSYRNTPITPETLADLIFRDIKEQCVQGVLGLILKVSRKGGLSLDVYRQTHAMTLNSGRAIYQ